MRINFNQANARAISTFSHATHYNELFTSIIIVIFSSSNFSIAQAGGQSANSQHSEAIAKVYSYVSANIAKIRLLAHQGQAEDARKQVNETLVAVHTCDIPSNDKQWIDREVRSALEEAKKETLLADPDQILPVLKGT